MVTPGKHEKYYLAGALHSGTGKVSYVGGNSKSSALFISLLKHLRCDIPTSKNDNTHRGQLYYPQKPENTAQAEAEPEVQGDLSAGLLAMGKSC